MYILNHAEKTYNVLDLPIDISKHLPEGMGAAMAQMMQFKASVTPTDETRTIEGWKTRRYDIALTSQMVQIEMAAWVTKDLDFDYKSAQRMMLETKSMQPGMTSAVEEMSKIDGFMVAQDIVSTMMGANVKSSEQVISIEEENSPAGTYDPPAGYSQEELDFTKLMQR
jgi:hypothetical protein